MAVLFLDFYNNIRSMNGDKKKEKNIYSAPLTEQFDLINNRLLLKFRYNDIKSFIQDAFPSGLPKNYYLSCPNYLRIFDKREAVTYLRNVVIRAELGPDSRFGKNTSVILIGDISIREELRSFRVKGIEIIDEGFTKKGESIMRNVYASYAFEYEKWSRNDDYSNSYFTPNVILDITKENYPVQNPETVREYYEKWDEYTKFREYYLKTQTDRYYEIKNVEDIDAYSLNRRIYQRNKELYETYLLDKHKDFSKGQQIILSEQLDETEAFHLIKVNVEYNREEFNKHNIEKKNRVKNEIETSLRSFARENVALSSKVPSNKEYTSVLRSSYLLDKRFKIIKTEIEPDCRDIEIKFEEKSNQEKEIIEKKYKKKIETTTEIYLQKHTLELEEEDKKSLSNYSIRLADKIDDEVKRDGDPIIKRKYEALIKEGKTRLSKELKAKEKAFDDRIKNSKSRFYVEKYRIELEKIRKIYKVSIGGVHLKIDLKKLYEERNKNLVEDKKTSLTKVRLQNLEKNRINKLKEIADKYEPSYRKELEDTEERLQIEMNQEIQKRIIAEAIVRFSIYFKTDLENKNKVLDEIHGKGYLIYNNRAEAAKIERQRNALDSFFEGNVKNPYLSTYLFAPEELNDNNHELNEWDWFLKELNVSQKKAVMSAVSSNGVFLLQGPPGTGKTQVIAEIVGHLVKQGKKVLISSETHKAIDNVFERLPKIAEIRPIRLIASHSKKESEFSPSNLVDNLYHNIAGKMHKTITSYENYTEYKDKFSEEKSKLKLLQSKLIKNKKASIEIAKEISDINLQYLNINEKKASFEEEKEVVLYDKDIMFNTYKKIEHNQILDDEYIDMVTIREYRNNVLNILTKTVFNLVNLGELLNSIQNTESPEIQAEINVILSKQDDFTVNQQINKIKMEISDLMEDHDLGHPKIELKQKEMMRLKSKQSKSSNNQLNNLTISKIFAPQYLSDNPSDLLKTFKEAKLKLLKLKNEYNEIIQMQIKAKENEIRKVEFSISKIKDSLKELSNQIIMLREGSAYTDYQESKNRLEVELEKFFKDFDLVFSYNDVNEAITVIDEEWKNLEKDFTSREEENKLKIPMYKKITEYLSQEEVVLEDRKIYTKPLFSLVNLYGSTTTSRDHFSEKSMSDLSDYNLGDIDLKKQGIDVVIIDEVSKSSFIELLIPILYGKTVILVGDHRQLPPMYEYRNFRGDDFEGLDENIINKYKNDSFTKMYEESFFKTLFEKAPKDYKIMLDEQYRCHEDIMDVFNHFYNKSLKLGLPNQNQQKKHYLNVDGISRRLIEQDKHIYFIDSKDHESRNEDSTSIQNRGEADIVIELLKKINNEYKKSKEFRPDVNKSKRIDKRMSVGVICTYGDQARLIKQKAKGLKFKSFNESSGSRLVISTVDDFQGDERDIIIVSMVRNPQDQAKSNPGFINAYQRVNVAFSRARRLLIIVGNKNYLIKKGVVDLPDVMGNTASDQKDFRIYDRIIETIKQKGKMLDDADILNVGVVK